MRVLIVEDEPLICTDLADIALEAGFEVTTALSLHAATARLSCEFDIAILDVRLSDGEIFPFAKILQDRKIPIGFITGFVTSKIDENGFRECMRITKPFFRESVIEMLNRLSGR